MSTEENLHKIGSLTASADLSASQFCGAKVSGVNTVTVGAAAADVVIGVIQNKPTSGQAVELAVGGVSKVKAGAAVTAGAQLMMDASGRFITAATTGSRVYGVALETAGAANEIIRALLIPGAHLIP